MIDGLAFVPECDVSSALEYVREVAPEEAQPLLNYFDSTYVSGSTISTVGRERHIPQLFQPAIWNVFHSTLNGQSRTNNYSEGWNSHFNHLIAKDKHVSIYRLIDALQCDTADVSVKLLRYMAGNLSPQKQSKAVKKSQDRLRRLCQEYKDGKRDLADFLKAIAHGIRFA